MLYFFAHNFFVPVRIVFKKKTLRFCFAVENSGSSSFSFHNWTEFKKNKTREDIWKTMADRVVYNREDE